MTRIRLIAIAAALCLLVTPAFAQKANIVGDLQHGAVGTTPCGSCHTPHNGLRGETLLWVWEFNASNNYGTYTSASLDNATVAIVAPAVGVSAGTGEENNSLLCLSCHDGAAAATNLVVTKTLEYAAVGTAIAGLAIDVGADLSNDHPINMPYDPIADPGLDSVVNAETAGLKFFTGIATNTVQCASCHNPHDNTLQDYLRVTNTASAICLECHL